MEEEEGDRRGEGGWKRRREMEEDGGGRGLASIELSRDINGAGDEWDFSFW